MMDIVIISQYLRNIEDFNGNNSRFVYLAKLLVKERNNKVEIITSDFNHATKKHFSKIGELEDIKITALHEKGYPKNVCLSRFGSHRELAKNIRKYLSNRTKPEIIYCAVPSLDVAKTASKYCRINNIKFMIDIQDLWPEAFQMVFNTPILSNLIFYPMRRQANYIYKNADKIIAVSETYKNRAMEINEKDKSGTVVYLGTDLCELDKELKKQEITYIKQKERIWIGYLGTIGSSYDIKTALDATKLVQQKYNSVNLVLLGDGPLLNKCVKYTAENDINAIFLGRKNYIEAMKILSQCDIVLNPLVKRAAQSIINKVGDYAALGLPVVNSLHNDEYIGLLKQYKAGINVECENPIEMKNAIIQLVDNPEKRKLMGNNNRKLAEEKFNRNQTYKKIIAAFKKDVEQ